MNIFQIIIIALKSIMSNKVRSILTMLGVIIGVASVITMVSVMQGALNKSLESFVSQSNQIQVSYYGDEKDFAKIFDEFLDQEVGQYIDVVVPNVQGGGEKVSYLNKVLDHPTIVYTNQHYAKMKEFTIEKGRNLAVGDIQSRTKSVVIGSYINKEFFGGLSNPVGKKLKIGNEEYTVVGVLKETFNSTKYSQDNIVIIPISRTIFNPNLGNDINYTIVLKDTEKVLYVEDYINANLKNHFKDANKVSAYSDKQWIDQYNKQMQLQTLIVGAIGGISLIVGGIGIMNIMLVSVTERTREIGIRMSIGAKRKDIITQFLIEAASVSGFGGIIGILLGTFLTIIIGSFITQSIMYPSVGIVIGSFVFSVLLGVIFGIHPANKASKLNPIDALRTQ